MKSNWAKRWGIILILLGFASGIPGVWLLIAHARYEATARINMHRDAKEEYEPYFFQTQFEIIKSDIILGQAIETLDLRTEWGKRYANGRKLEIAETIEVLKQSIRLSPYRSTALIDISIISEDPTEAAKIANTIAEIFLDYRWKHDEKKREEQDAFYRMMIR